MEYRKLGKSGLKVSEMGLGGANFGMHIGEDESIAVIRKALDEGINFIDSADEYGQGYCERYVGKAIKGRRSEVIIASKFCMPTGPGPNDRGGSRYHILQAIENSLKRLDTDYIDVYYLHAPDPTTPIEETLRTLDYLVKMGKVRYIGCSKFAAWQLCESAWTSKTNNLEPFTAIEAPYNLIERGIELELVPCCEAYGVGLIPYTPLASGFLTGKYKRGKSAPEGTRFGNTKPPLHGQWPPIKFNPYLTDSNYDKLEKWEKFASEHDHNMHELAISWLLSHSYVSSVIAGATRPEQVSANVAAANWKLTAQELTELRQLTEIN